MDVKFGVGPVAIAFPFLNLAAGIAAGQVGGVLGEDEHFEHLGPALAGVQGEPDPGQGDHQKRQQPPQRDGAQQGKKRQKQQRERDPDKEHEPFGRHGLMRPEAQLLGFWGSGFGPTVRHGRSLCHAPILSRVSGQEMSAQGKQKPRREGRGFLGCH